MAERRRETMTLRRTLILSAAFVALAILAACAQPGNPGRSASTTSGQDVLGSGGRTDDVYRQIYHPGSGTQF